MDYADENMPEQNAGEKQVIAAATPTQTGAEEKTDGKADASPIPEQTPYQEIMQNGTVDYSKITYDKDSQLKEMMEYWADSNQKALDDLASLDRFRAMSYSLRGSTDFYYYGDKDSNGLPSGTGIAVYADNQYYYGTWKDGKRDGKGTFIHYHVHNDSKIQICIRIISTRADLQMICRMEKDPSILILIRRISRRVNVMWATGSAVTVVDF